MAGIELPLMTLEHQYFVTETIPEIEALDTRLPLGRRSRRRVLPAPGRAGVAGRRLRKGRAFLGRGRYSDGFRPRVARRGPGSYRGKPDARLRARAGADSGRGQARDQRADDLVARQLGADRSGAGTEELLLLLRHHPRLFAVGRARCHDGAMDHAGRTGNGPVPVGPGALRQLGQQGFHQGARARSVLAPFQDSFSLRGARSRAADQVRGRPTRGRRSSAPSSA